MARIGTTLRDARLARGLSIDQAAQDTRISARFLEALEDEAFEELPAPVYVRGFLRSYANYLRVDPVPLLQQLDEGGGRRMAGPDSFVTGPATPQRPTDPFRRSDPFQRNPPPPPPPAPAAPPPRARFEEDDAWGAGLAPPEDGYEDDYDEEIAVVGAAPPLVGRTRRGDGEAFDHLPPEEARFHSRGVSGVLAERRTAPAGASPVTRMVAIAGVAVFALVVVAALAILLRGGSDGDDAGLAAGDGSATQDRGTGTVVTLRSPSPTAPASASPAGTQTPGSPTPGSTGTPTPGGTPTPTPTAGQPTPTPTPGEPTPTPTTAPPTPTPTPTEVPPTPTPVPTAVPPTPTPVPTAASHPNRFDECGGAAGCGTPPWRVVCAPDGWFVDVGGDFPVPAGWTTAVASSGVEAATACP